MNPRFLTLTLLSLLSSVAIACDDCKKASKINGPVVEYDLTIAEQTVSPAGTPVRGFTINGGIPGPTLRFKEGDWARIRVHNQLKDKETSTHWHGLLASDRRHESLCVVLRWQDDCREAFHHDQAR